MQVQGLKLKNMFLMLLGMPQIVTNVRRRLTTVWPSSCSGLTSFQNSCTCTAIGVFALEAGDSMIPSHAFNGCSQITSITGLNNIVSVGLSAFQSTGLVSFEWPSGANTIPERAFYNTLSLSQITGCHAEKSAL